MQVHILAFGKLKSQGFEQISNSYLKRIRSGIAIDVQELRPHPVMKWQSAEIEQAQKKESETFEKALQGLQQKGGSSQVFLLDKTGEKWSTEAWAQSLQTLRNESGQGTRRIIFGIGSSIGFEKRMLAQATQCISLGAQTMAHELVRIVLLEQLYRAWSSIQGHPYHHA